MDRKDRNRIIGVAVAIVVILLLWTAFGPSAPPSDADDGPETGTGETPGIEGVVDESYDFDQPVSNASGQLGVIEAWSYDIVQDNWGAANPDERVRVDVHGQYNGTEERTVRTNWSKFEDGSLETHTEETTRRVHMLHHQLELVEDTATDDEGPAPTGIYDLWLPTDLADRDGVTAYPHVRWRTPNSSGLIEYAPSEDLQARYDRGEVDTVSAYHEGVPSTYFLSEGDWWGLPHAYLYTKGFPAGFDLTIPQYKFLTGALPLHPASDLAGADMASRPVTVEMSGHRFEAYNITSRIDLGDGNSTAYLVVAPGLPLPVEYGAVQDTADPDTPSVRYRMTSVSLREA